MRTVWTGCCVGSGLVLVAAVAYVAAGEPETAASVRVAAVSPVAAGTREPAVSPAKIVDRYCLNCHNDIDFAADLSFEALDMENVAEEVDTWEKVVRKLRVRAMPPHGRDTPRPDESEYEAMLAYLEGSLDAHARTDPDPGRPGPFHRMNRTEYQNAIRDLLDLEVQAVALLPDDEASHGFDNVNVRELSPTLLDRYIAAARTISRVAVGTARRPDAHTVVLPLDLTQNEHFEPLPLGTRGGTAFRHTFPQDATYQFQIRLTRDRDDRIEGITEPVEIELAVDGERLHLFTLMPPVREERQPSAAYAAAQGELDAGLTGRFPVKAGPHTITLTFLKKPSVLSEAARQPFWADYNGRHMAALFSVSVAGPFDPSGAGDTPSRRRIFVCRPATPDEESGCAMTILSTLARRAYRRPAAESELNDLLRFYREGRQDGSDFEAGIEMALRALLVSPNFLFRIERDPAGVPPNTPYRLSDLELVSRLSFFLWSSIPDDQLLDLAVRGTLRNPGVLEQEVRRMLSDPRSEALVTSFAGQWLHLRNLSASAPDPRLFPDFDDNLRQAFRRETELFFASIKREDRSLLDLLRADFTFVNERLARHYGIPNVYGSHFRRVTLPPGSRRAGLLGHASVLTVTSYGDRTSPVLRGKWILENILGLTPPPPPPDVTPLEEPKDGGRPLTGRDRIAQHRENPACAGCHNLMDPIGLSTENFDAIGRWRTRDAGMPIDASGGLPDGAVFDGMEGLRQALLRRPDLFATTATEKLLTYAIGRGLEAYDAPAVRAIVRDGRAEDYRFSSLVLGVVNSAPFQMRRSQ